MRTVRSFRLWPFLVLAALCLCSGPGPLWASKPRCRLERIEPPAADKNGLRVLASVVELEGDVAAEQASSYRLLVNGKTVAQADSAVPFTRSDLMAQVVLLVEVSALYARPIDKIRDALHEFVDSLPPRFKIKLIEFGNEVDQKTPFLTGPALSPAIDDINPDDEGDIQLVGALSAGLRALSQGEKQAADTGPQQKPRKLMVVLSDGLNPTMERRTFRQLGGLLSQGGVTLFPIAFSPRDDRGPLLNLGELAKRSAGTFRWAKNEDDLKERFQSLSEELQKLQVVTFPGSKLDPAHLGQAEIALMCGSLTSNSIKLMGGPVESDGSWWKWLLGIVLGLFALWAGARGAVYLLDRRGKQPAAVPPVVPRSSAVVPVVPAVAPVVVPVAPAFAQPAAGAFTLVIIGGQRAGERVPLSGGLRIGKSAAGPGTLTIADDPTVSGNHCELRRDAGGYVLVDLGSTNGSFVNDRRVSGPTRLQNGDLLRLGSGTQFKFRID